MLTGGGGGGGWQASALVGIARTLMSVVFTVVLTTSLVEVLFYVHRNRRSIRDGSSGRPPRLSHSS